jgi:hypothetical protein
MSLRNFIPIYLLGITLLLTASYAEESAISGQSSVLSSVESLKQVESICIGSVAGDPVGVKLFVEKLKEQLPKKGFTLSNDQNACDATIVGRFWVFPLGGVFKTNSAAVEITLQNHDLKTIWEETITPPQSLVLGKRMKDRRFGEYAHKRANYPQNRAVDLASFLQADKKRLK